MVCGRLWGDCFAKNEIALIDVSKLISVAFVIPFLEHDDDSKL